MIIFFFLIWKVMCVLAWWILFRFHDFLKMCIIRFIWVFFKSLIKRCFNLVFWIGRTKALVLELLAAVCLVSGGHDIILSAFDNFKDVSTEIHFVFIYFLCITYIRISVWSHLIPLKKILICNLLRHRWRSLSHK